MKEKNKKIKNKSDNKNVRFESKNKKFENKSENKKNRTEYSSAKTESHRNKLDYDMTQPEKKRLMQVFESPMYRPMKLKELAILLGIPKEDREILQFYLNQLVSDGKIGVSSKGRYGKPQILTETGTFMATQKGFGFVRPDVIEGAEQKEDIFIPAEYVNFAMNNDRVQVSVTPKSGDRHAEGRVLSILEHAVKTIVGTYQSNKRFGFVVSDNPKISMDLFIPDGKSMDAANGQKVVARVIKYAREGHKPEGEVTEILGYGREPGVDILSIARSFDIPDTFSEEVKDQAAGIAQEVLESQKAGRTDYRDLVTVTIDGEDAKDLDDAISLVKKEDGYELGVHIADVSEYVKEGSPLDLSALERGTSVYLTDRVIPMLPFELSNGICSLNEGTDRLALSCVMTINDKGVITDHRIEKTLIRVNKRMCYTAVASVLRGEIPAGYEEYEELLKQMHTLSKILRNNRHARGAIDFDFPEAKIILDEKGKPVEIKPYERNDATMMIEDFMLAANETIAEDAYWEELPFLYRNHESPSPEKMEQFAVFINNFGHVIHFKNQEIHPKELQKLLEKIAGTEEEAVISRTLLRSMKQAKYSSESIGHFGLSARYYTHFTSPIRRYPDLQIHRILKEKLDGRLNEDRELHYDRILPEVADQSSKMERRADEAEREVEKRKKAQYMIPKIGEIFEGVISGVTGWGFYVELPNTVEGLVHVNDLRDDYYTFDEQNMRLVGDLKKKEYALGKKVTVLLDSVDLNPPSIHFCIPVRFGNEEE